MRYCTSCLAIYRTDFERCPLDGGQLAMSAYDPLVGMTIGRYVIESKIGEGGMGRVYRAHRIDDPTQEVALKILLGDLAASNVMRQRFAREAEAARQLSHPNIVGVLDFGHTPAGLPFLVMELVEGTNLALILQKGPMQGDRVIRIARQLCDALDHAHGRGVIHRDFKPDNILVVNEGPEERVKIADFGLALSQNDETRLTMTGVACTPAYAAPEQLRGGTIDSRVDLYALGTSMFEMLTGGMLPFESDLQGTIRLKLAGEAPNLATIVPDMQPALATLVARLLSHDADRRPRSARSLMIALDAALKAPKRKLRTQDLAPQTRGSIVTFPPTKAQRAATKRLRKSTRPSRRTYAALAVAAIMIGAALASIIRSHAPEAEARTIAQPSITMTVHAQPIAATAPVETMPVVQPVVAKAPAAQPKLAMVSVPAQRLAVVKKPSRSVARPQRIKRHVAKRAAPATMPDEPDAIIDDADVEDSAPGSDVDTSTQPPQPAPQAAAPPAPPANRDAILDSLPEQLQAGPVADDELK
ncbi:MAG TPA: serine/threonine-protein kinase [Kofleriaceae bacterium]|nr:serine/threonine-protein kinase [Kofleriaceae bacterium]